MQLHSSSPPSNPRQRRPRPPDRRAQAEEAEWKRMAWMWFWIMVGGKLVIMVALTAVALNSLHPTTRGWTVVALLNWSWILLAGFIVVGPAAYWWRLRRVRRKRAALIRAEWNVN